LPSTRTFNDIDLDFGRHPVTNDVNVVEDAIAIKRSVRNLVLTNFYERPFHPELGCGIRGLLFENFNPVNSMFLKRKIEECLVNNEPRIVLTGIIINGENLSGSVLDVRNQNADIDSNRLRVDIHFTVIGVPLPQVVSMNLQRLR
jgi:phage baseplate assembly protein W